ncbi:MAG TPA: tol-pal system protein YbgF [Gammaproteobacteria bacterium]|nr:tol-pal system protein YbgF [Gammaproteobacteria bacterium]
MMRVAGYSVMLVVLAALGGCATGVQPNDPYAIRVDQLSQQVDRLQRVVTNQNQVSLGQRLDQLAEQVRTLRGQVQELAHAVDESNRRQRDLYQDLDQRLRALETGTAAGANQGASMVPGSESGRTAYDHAFNLLQQGNYQQAEGAFTAFLAQHADSDLADNAEYWLGEARYVSRDFKGAVQAFQAVANGYPDSPKVPGALLKMGYSYAELEQWDEAKQALRQVVQNYGDSTEARLARDRLKQLKSQGH